MEQYIFSPTACESGLEEELAAALEKRTEVISRASFPNMWEKTDALNRYAARGRTCLLYTSPSPRDRQKSRMPSSA